MEIFPLWVYQKYFLCPWYGSVFFWEPMTFLPVSGHFLLNEAVFRCALRKVSEVCKGKWHIYTCPRPKQAHPYCCTNSGKIKGQPDQTLIACLLKNAINWYQVGGILDCSSKVKCLMLFSFLVIAICSMKLCSLLKRTNSSGRVRI